MKVLKQLFKCTVVGNLVVYFAFVFIMLAFSPSRDVSHRCGAVVIACMAALLLLSVIVLFFDRRAAVRGFLVLLLGFIIGILFPEL
jgi:hypothetical protein